MGLEITFESYDGESSLYGNAGDYINGVLEFTNEYLIASSDSIPYTISGNNKIELPEGMLWTDYGFLPGDSINVYYEILQGPNTGIYDVNTTITYISGNTMFVAASVALVTGVYPDQAGDLTEVIIQAGKAPESIEFRFNLTQNGVLSDESLIDGEINRFVANNVNDLSATDSMTMTQMGNKSGGWVYDVTLTFVATSGIKRFYKIEYGFWQSVIIQDGFGQLNYTQPGFEKLEFYKDAAHVAPYVKLFTYGKTGNPNGVFTAETTNVQANTGDQGESYNGAPNPYVVESISWFDLNDDPIDAMDYSNASSFVALIVAPDQTIPSSEFRLGVAWLPADPDVYKNNINPIVNNLIVNAPINNFIHAVAPDPFVWTGFTHPDGSRLDLSDIQFFIDTPYVTVRATITPNAAFRAKFAQLGDGDRRIRIWTKFEDPALDFTVNNPVNIPLFDEDAIDAPTIGVQFTDISNLFVYDHAGNEVPVTIDPLAPDVAFQTITTEDDVRLLSTFRLQKGEEYDGVNVRLFSRDMISGSEFTLEERFFDFTNDTFSTFVGGKYEVDFFEQRTLGLPAGSDRNKISLARDASVDTLTEYGIKLDYGFLSRWEYWLAQDNVDDFFFDLTMQNNGLNKNWQRYSSLGIDLPDPLEDILRFRFYMAYYVRKNGVDDYVEIPILIRDFEDDPDVSTTVTFTRSDASTPSVPPANELFKITTVFDWNMDFVAPWVEFKYEPFEGGPPVIVSSILDMGPEGFPFRPLDGETKIKLTLLGTQLTAECMFDGTLIDVNNISLSYRVSDVGSEPTEFVEFEDGVAVQFEDGVDVEFD